MPKPRRGNKRATKAAAPAAPVAAMEKLAVAEQATAPASPLEQAFAAVAAACKGVKTFEGAAATAVDAFNAETFAVETFLAVDGVTILKNELLCNKKNSVAREAGLKIVESLLAKWGEAGISVLITTAKAVLNLIGDKRSKAVRELRIMLNARRRYIVENELVLSCCKRAARIADLHLLLLPRV